MSDLFTAVYDGLFGGTKDKPKEDSFDINQYYKTKDFSSDSDYYRTGSLESTPDTPEDIVSGGIVTEPPKDTEDRPIDINLVTGAIGSTSELAKGNTIAKVYNELLHKEGASGDTTGAAETGTKGLTKSTYDGLKKKYGDLTEEQAIQKYLEESYDNWSSVEGFSSASQSLQELLLDSSYNLGSSVLGYSKLKRNLKKLAKGKASESDVAKELLDTANIGGKTSKGLAVRRAENYNKVAPVKIAEVKQKRSGKIEYLDSDGNVIYSYQKPRHSSSSAGSVLL